MMSLTLSLRAIALSHAERGHFALESHDSPHPRRESPLAGTARQGRGRAVPRQQA
jgi:hypothetical protein